MKLSKDACMNIYLILWAILWGIIVAFILWHFP